MSSAQGTNFSLHPRVEIHAKRIGPRADDRGGARAYRFPPTRMLRPLINWLTRSNFGGGNDRLPPEAVVLRALGLAWLVVLIVVTATTRPQPGLSAKGLAIGAALVALVVCAVGTQPRRDTMPQWQRIALLFGVTGAAAVLAALQPHGIWELAPYFVGILAAVRLGRVAGLVTLAISLVVLVLVAVLTGHGGEAVSITTGAVPWFLVMRLMAETRRQRDALELSREAEARAAAEAERGRISREMHDVLAHSLSALALQLESARLLARDRGTDPEVTSTLDAAHHVAAAGLDEARRAIAEARGEELPGPERLPALAEAFEEQSGVAATFELCGEPRDLPPDARLAIYRTVQEALTNIRRHATPERVELKLEYTDQATVLAVEDHAARGAPAPAALADAGGGYGLSGMRERAELLGGRLVAEPTADGFRVELRLPVQAGAAPSDATPLTTTSR